MLGERRYIVCRNPIAAKQDAADRDALLAKLRRTLAQQGPKAIVGNRGYARYLTIAKGSVTLDEAAVAREARLDGKFVLTTSTELPAAEVALPISPCGGSSVPSASSNPPSTSAPSSTNATTA